MRIYLDFDGVIAYSAVECVNTAFCVWCHSQQHGPHGNAFSSLVVDKDVIIRRAIENRSLVIPPEHYYCLIQAVYEEAQSYSRTSNYNIASRFDNICRNSTPEVLSAFRNKFFEFRNEKFARQSDVEWALENPITPFTRKLFEMIKPYSADVFVVSRKNYSSIAKWLSGSQIKVTCIFGNEELAKFGGSKFNLISKYEAEFSSARAVFVDDMAFEFDANGWLDIGVITLEAGWGYNHLADNTDEVLGKIRGLLE